MNKYIITGFMVAIVVMIAISCQPHAKNGENISAEQKKTVDSQNIKPSETGYADINGLKMYYEVYGNGKPIVLLHGSFMNIPINWGAHYTPVCQRPENNSSRNAGPRPHKRYIT